MLPFPVLSYRHKKNDWGKDQHDIYEDHKLHYKRGGLKFSLSYFAVPKMRLCAVLACLVLFGILSLMFRSTPAFSNVCNSNNRQNADISEYCSFDTDHPDYNCTPVSSLRPPFTYVPVDSSLPPVVSVVVPFFNDYKYLDDVFNSLDIQSLKLIEVIVVNDGSTQEATQHMTDIVQQRGDSRIRIVSHTKNRGLSAARNTGIANSRTDYIFFIDSDDLIEPTTLEKCVWTLISHPYAGFTKGYTVGFGGHSYKWEKGFELAEKFLQENMVTATAMIRKSVFDEIGGYDESIKGGMEDWEFWLKCANHGIWGITIPEYLDWYRRKPKSTESKWTNFNRKDRSAFLDVLRERYKDIFKLNGFPKLKSTPQINYEIKTSLPFTNPLMKSKPRLLAVVPWFTMGGADRFNLNLIEKLIERGWEVTLVATHTIASTWTSHFSRLTPDLFILSNNLRYSDYPRFLCYLIASRDIDVVMVTNSEAGYLLLPYIRSMCPGPAVVDYTHMEEMDWKNGGYPRYSVAYTDHIDRHAVASVHLKRWMTTRNVPDDQIDVVYIGVDPTIFVRDKDGGRSVREMYGIPADRVTILYAARMIPQKQPMVMVNAFKKLVERNIKFTALIAGTGWQRPQIDEFIARYDLGKYVLVLGEVPPEQMPTLMAACDIVFLPSEFEGIASILFEAMAIENVIVGADVGGQAELVTPDVGYLQNITGFETKSDAAVDMLAEYYAGHLGRLVADPDALKSMGAKGRQRVVDHFSLENMVVGMENTFCEAVKQKDQRPRLPARTAIETAIQAMQSINAEENAYDMYTQHEQQRQKLEDARLVIAQCEIEQSELLAARTNYGKCKSELTSVHDQYMRCEQDLAILYLKMDDLRAECGKDLDDDAT